MTYLVAAYDDSGQCRAWARASSEDEARRACRQMAKNYVYAKAQMGEVVRLEDFVYKLTTQGGS